MELHVVVVHLWADAHTVSLLSPWHSWSGEVEPAADGHRRQLGGRPPPRQEVWGFGILLR